MHTHSSIQYQPSGSNRLFPLSEVPNGEGRLTTVHVPLSFSDLCNWKDRSKGLKEDTKGVLNLVWGIFHTPFPTWVDVQTLLNIVFSVEEKTLIITNASEEADKTNQNNARHSIPALNPGHFLHGPWVGPLRGKWSAAPHTFQGFDS